MYCTVLYCTVLYCTVLHCIALHCIALHCIVLYCIVLYCIVLYCIVLYCIVLYCIVLYCTEISSGQSEERTTFFTYEKHRWSNQRPRAMCLHCSEFAATCVVSRRPLASSIHSTRRFVSRKVVGPKWKRIDSPTSVFHWRIKWRVLKTNQDVKLLKECLANEKHDERDVYLE